MRRGGKSRRWALIALLAPSTVLLAGCSSENLPALGFPRGVTDINDLSLSLWQGAWVSAFIVGAFTAVLILWAALRYRVKRKVGTVDSGAPEKLPEQVSYHLPLEIIYTVVPLLSWQYSFISPHGINQQSPRFHQRELPFMRLMSMLFSGLGN